MSTRNAYTALTPDYANLVMPRSPEVADHAQRPPNFASEELESEPSRWCSVLTSARDIVSNNAGLLLVLAAQAFFSLMNVAVKELNMIDLPVPTLELILVRMGITWVCSIIYMVSTNVPDPYFGPREVRWLLAFRGLSGFFGLFGIYYSLKYLSLSDATVLTFLAPLCTGVSGSIFLKEKFTRIQVFAGIFSLFGVVLIARPSFIFGTSNPHLVSSAGEGSDLPETPDSVDSSDRLVAVGVALFGVLGATGAYTSIRAIGKRAHPLHALTSFSLFCIIVAPIAMIATHTEFVIPQRLDWLALLILVGVFGFIAQVLLTMGLQRETAGRCVMAVYTQVIFASILERIFFHTVPSVLSVIGTLMIITSALYVAVTKEKDGTTKPKGTVSLAHFADSSLEEGLLARVSEEEERSQHKDRVFSADHSLGAGTKSAEVSSGRLQNNPGSDLEEDEQGSQVRSIRNHGSE